MLKPRLGQPWVIKTNNNKRAPGEKLRHPWAISGRSKVFKKYAVYPHSGLTRDEAQDASVVLVRVELREGVTRTELEAMTREGSSKRDTRTDVKGEEPTEALGHHLQAIDNPSKVFTSVKLLAAARPPDAMFTAQDLPECCFGVYFGNIFLIESSKDRLNACTEE